MKWSLLVGKFWGTEIRLHATMLLLIPYALLAFHPVDIASMARVVLLLAVIFACVALHEMGHTLAARMFGIQVSSIVLWPLGGVANLSRRPEKVLPDIIIAAAGPLTNLIIFAWLGFFTILERVGESATAVPSLSRFLYRTDAFALLAGLSIANLALALFNLVPVYPLDGGQIARGLLKGMFGDKWADRLMLLFSLPLALGLTILGLVIGDVVVILTGLILVLASLSLNLRLSNALALGVLYLFDRAGYYLRRSDYDPAVREYTRAIMRNPRLAGLYISRAVVYMNLMELKAARSDVDQAMNLDPNNYTAWTLRGELLSIEKNYTGALAAYNRAIALRPNWSIPYLDRAERYQQQGDYSHALEDMDKGVETAKGSPVAYLLRSQVRYEMGNLNGAHMDEDQALRYAPNWMLAFPEIFQTNLEGHLNWALDYYWRAILRMPGAYQVYQGRGDACRANDHPDWAIADYNRAIRLAPQEAELYLSRGRAYGMLGQVDKATADLQEASRLTRREHIRRQAQNILAQLTQAASPALPVLPLATGAPAASAESGEPGSQYPESAR